MRYFCSVFTLLFILSCVTIALCQNLTSPQVEVMENLFAFSSSWNKNGSDVDPCGWVGVGCSENLGVIELNLSGLGFKDNIWKTVCELPALKRLDVSNNSLPTPSSEEITACTNLTYLNVSSNLLSGTLPLLAPLKKLQYLDLSRNMLEGNFELPLKNLTELQFLYLAYNKFTGSIPYVIGGKKLEHLDVSRNELDGEIPQGLVEYTNLTSLDLSSNWLHGTIPENIGSLLNLQSLVLSANKLSGSIPKTLGKLSQLTRFAVNYNELSGTIPIELSSITGLKSLDLSYNKLQGSIPPKVFGMQNLQSLDLSDNSLSGSIPQNFSRNLFRLRIGNNTLNGSIPSTIGDALGLTYLEMNNNILDGNIPVQLGRCTKLQLLDFGQNQLGGPLTSVLPKLRDLQYLKLRNNHFEGSIINELSVLPNLTYVDLGGNRLSEYMSSKICELQRLQNLRLQNNHLIGPIPQDISNCQNLLELQLGSNKLNGSIPQGISKLNRLQIALNLSSNALDGTIPGLLSSLVTLEILDLSNNRLTGGIPISLVDMKSLTVLNLSNNQLTGIIPASLNRSSLVLKTEGNPGLSFGQSHSPVSKKKKVSAGLLVGVAVAGAIFALGAVALSMLACKFFKHNEPEVPEMQEPHKIEGHFIHSDSIHNLSIDFEKGVEATMDPANVVLKNKFSTYYKAAMPSGTSYSVKKLSWTDKIFKTGSYRKLEAELEKQGRLNHPNIMIPLAYVLDTECAYLFYEYVHKGTLAEFLHTSGVCVLDWPSRCNIAIGIAQGLAFLHGCQHPILHLDLTTKNILLKSLSEAQLADVELCKMVDPSKSTGSLSAIAGSVGYVPPEYAYTMRVTAAGNVYSFGVILLELLTGKPPITGGMDIAKWVQSTLSGEEAWEQILDMRIRNFSLQIQNEMLSMLKLALSCISSSPDARPKMRTVVGTLQLIRHSP